MFGGRTKNLKNQEYFDKNHICLPIHEQLSKYQIAKIVKKLKTSNLKYSNNYSFLLKI